jgi:hypothetical protein
MVQSSANQSQRAWRIIRRGGYMVLLPPDSAMKQDGVVLSRVGARVRSGGKGRCKNKNGSTPPYREGGASETAGSSDRETPTW